MASVLALIVVSAEGPGRMAFDAAMVAVSALVFRALLMGTRA